MNNAVIKWVISILEYYLLDSTFILYNRQARINKKIFTGHRLKFEIDILHDSVNLFVYHNKSLPAYRSASYSFLYNCYVSYFGTLNICNYINLFKPPSCYDCRYDYSLKEKGVTIDFWGTRSEYELMFAVYIESNIAWLNFVDRRRVGSLY